MDINFNRYLKIRSGLYSNPNCKKYKILDIGVGVSDMEYTNWNRKNFIEYITKILKNKNSIISDLNSNKLKEIFPHNHGEIRNRFVKYDICDVNHEWDDDMISKFDRIYLINVIKPHKSDQNRNISKSFPFDQFEKILDILKQPLKKNGKLYILNSGNTNDMEYEDGDYLKFGYDLSSEDKVSIIRILIDDVVHLSKIDRSTTIGEKIELIKTYTRRM